MKRVYHGVHGREDEAVTFAGRPVHEVAALDLGRGADNQAISPGMIIQQFGFQRRIARRQPIGIARSHPIGMGDKNHVRSPLGRPGRMRHQPVKSVPHHLSIAISVILTELVQIRIRLVSNPLALAIHINPGKRRGFDGIPAKLPDPVKHFIG